MKQIIEQPSLKPVELKDIVRLVETRASKPTYTPKNVQEQIVLVVEGANASLYVYDNSNHYWRATTLGT